MKRVKFLLFLLPAIILLLALPQPVYSAFSDTETFTATKDTYANKAYPDKVNGGYDHITLSNKFTDRLGYIQFENVDLPEGAILDSALLKFYVHAVYYADTAKLNVGPISGDWEENSLTWNNKPTINQTQATEATISIADSGWKEVSVTHVVSLWLEGTAENKGLFIYPYGFLYATPETEFALSFRSKEASENNPKLEVAYHFEPEPTSSPSPAPEPSPTPEASPGPAEEETPTPAPEESPTPTPEEEKEGTVSGLSTGQMVIGGLILLSLAGAGIALLVYALRKPKKKAEKEPAKGESASGGKEEEAEEKKEE